jgi:exodeoxyribonuclease V alpha subunit
VIPGRRPGAATARFLAGRGEPPEGITASEPHRLDDDDFEASYLAWEIARCARRLEGPEASALEALAVAVIEAIRAGSTRVGCERRALAAALGSADRSEALSTASALVARARDGEAGDPARDVIGRPGERKPLVVDGPWLYAERMHALEGRFCARVRARASLPPGTDARAIQRAVANLGASPPLTDEQKRAVKTALGSALSLVTGGPGSGKTATAVAVVRALTWLGTSTDSIAIAAPTGKAAQRLSGAIRQALSASSSKPRDLVEVGLDASALVPQTLHRLLGWSPSRGRFGRHEGDPLPHKVVVVDEASMIDLALMDRLFRSVRPDARLVLFGDADQLPSIDAGAVFRDLCAGMGAVRLTKNLRVADEAGAARIVGAARAVNAGDLGAEFAASVRVHRAADTLAFEGVEHLDAPWAECGAALLDRWWSERVAADADFARRSARAYRVRDGRIDDADADDVRALFAGHARARVLCATRVRGFAAGADAIGDQLVAKLRGPAPGNPRRRDLPAGTPILVQRNDYDRGLYNGDQGIVLGVEQGRGVVEPMAVFPRDGAFEALPLDSAGDLAQAFAMTVHKAQGSEFDHVAVVLPEEDLPLLTRELLYTALTRARRSVVLVGPADLLARAVARTMLRESGVAEKLKMT